MTKAKFEELVKELVECGDVTVVEFEKAVFLTFEDFEGFTEEYEEVEREFVKPELVEKLLEVFEGEVSELFGKCYHVHFASEEI